MMKAKSFAINTASQGHICYAIKSLLAAISILVGKRIYCLMEVLRMFHLFK